ncbi:MAG: zinc ribbon domain-containing protein [Candidatus Thorarchaeota archaeon]
MTEKGFMPLTSELGVPGTSYRIQLGLINDKWASRLLKGRDVIESYVYKDEDTEGGFPNQNLIVGWVLRTVAIPNINPHQVMKTTQALVKQALRNKEERKVIAPISETKEVELEKVPQSELKRPPVQGWVKKEDTQSQEELEEERRQAFKQRVAAQKEREQAPSTSFGSSAPPATSSVTTLKTSRQLPSIPKEGDEGSAPEISEGSKFCPHCGKNLDWKFCPYCGKPLPHD